MGEIAWDDLNPAEQRVIAALGAGLSTRICDADALRALRRAGLIRRSGLTPKGEELRRAAVLRTLAPQLLMVHSAA
jgi:hypothetical protein